MKNAKRILLIFLALVAVLAMAACGGDEQKTENTSEVKGDYYIDLTELGMKLTIYLRLDDKGNFRFSNTLSFAVDKSSGTFKKSGDKYIMIYTSVNGEPKSISDGLTSVFGVRSDGNLDFTECDRIYYGSAMATTTSADNPEAKMIAIVVPEGFVEPSSETDFTCGVYTAEPVTNSGVTYNHSVSFFEDGTYLQFTVYEKDGKTCFFSEKGIYSVSTTQLAVTPDGDKRTESEVISKTGLGLSVLPYPEASERERITFKKTETEPETVAVLEGEGKITGSDKTFKASFKIFSDGSYLSEADGFTEKGLIFLNSEEGYAKQYPDNTQTGERGIGQVTMVAAGKISYGENLKLVLTDMRVRTSVSLTRYKCTVYEK